MDKSTRQRLTKVYSDLYKFSHYTYGRRYKKGKHIKDLCSVLTGVAKGEIKRLIVNLPPRHSKTQTCSVNFPVQRLFHNPDLKILVVTYGDDLSEEIGTKARALIKEHGHYFNVYLSSHTASKTKIRLQDRDGKTYKGGIEALGYKGAITGKDADIVIIDDLIKGPEDALSPTQNKKVIEFYKSAIFTRLFEDSIIILVSTRWSKNDLAGHLLTNSTEDWKTFIKPAIDENGNPLWPERFSKERMAVIQEEEGPFWWSALYLQEPEELKGDVFEGEFLQIPREEIDFDDFKRYVRFWDRAATEQKDSNDPDWTVGLLMAELKPDAKLKEKYPQLTHIVLGVVRFRGSPATNQKRIKNTTLKDQTNYGGVESFMEQEPGSSGKDTIDTYRNVVLYGFKFRGIRSTGSKHVRAIDVAAAVEIGKVGFLEADWNGNLFLEMRAFPHGSHDDQIDTLSGSYNQFKKKTVLKPKRRRR